MKRSEYFLTRLIQVLFWCIASISLIARDKYPKNYDIDIIHYKFELSLSGDSDMINGKATVEVRFKKEGISSVALDLGSLIESGENAGKGMLVDSVSADFPVVYSHTQNVLNIKCPVSKKEQTVSFVIHYHGIPVTGLHIKPNRHGDKTFFSDNWPNLTHNWLPVVDHPYDKATCEFIVTAPNKYGVVSNGLKIEESSIGNGLKRTHWKQSVPIASWLYVLGVAEFAIQHVDNFEGKSIETWVMYQHRDTGFHIFSEPTKAALSFFSDYVGPFAYEKLANIQSNSVSGGMEAASAILYAEQSVSAKNIKSWRHVVIHEIAHQWFGNAVTESDWDDVWLSEGFATYFTDLFLEHAYGYDAFIDNLRQERKRVFQHHKEHPHYSVIHENLQNMDDVTSLQTYYKGAWVLHMLRNLIGDTAFKQGIRNYYKKFYNGNATTADFQYELEQASGVDLKVFFQQWLVQKGNLFIKGSWQYNKKAKEIVVTLQQTQSTGIYDFTIETGIWKKGQHKPEIHYTHIKDMSPHSIRIPVTEEPEKVELDPRVVLLSENSFINR